jgi:farnesyl-diphosphate farnesyltransferase
MSVAVESVETWSGKDRGDENFPVGSALIAAPLRKHVHAFYAFARNADDIADSASLAPADKVARLDVMEEVLLGRRDVGSPSATRLRASLDETGATPQHSCELLVAFRRDATKLRYANWEELYDYCRYSAMPVGRYVLDLHGEPRDTWTPSDALCTSLQVLNHLQDCTRDLGALDRCYLPEDLMRQFGAERDELRGDATTPGLRRVFDALLDQCDELNHAAIGLPRSARSRRLRLETAVIVGLAHRLAARLRRFDPMAARVKLGKGDVALSVLGALRFLA